MNILEARQRLKKWREQGGNREYLLPAIKRTIRTIKSMSQNGQPTEPK